MLVLSRMKNDSIMIGHGIEIKILDIKDNKVRLGIKAPPDMRISRPDEHRNSEQGK